MLFKRRSKKESDGQEPRRRRAGGVFGVVRVFLSLCMISIMLLGLAFALQHLSGVRSTEFGQGINLRQVFSSEQLYQVVSGALSVNPMTTLSRLKQLIAGAITTEHSSSVQPSSVPATKVYTFAVVTDSHNDNSHLSNALKIAKSRGAAFVVGLGDYTDVGTIDELRNSKNEFDIAGMNYYVTAGDHDLWDARNKSLPPQQNFQEVFGSPYSTFAYKGTRFIIIYDADDYLGLDAVQQKWVEDVLNIAKQEGSKDIFVLTSTPFWHPSSDHAMGRVEPKLKDQAVQLIKLCKDKAVNEIFAGDAHFFSRYTEPATGLKMTVVGAVTSTRNLQQPRFVLVDVYSDGSYNIQDTEIK